VENVLGAGLLDRLGVAQYGVRHWLFGQRTAFCGDLGHQRCPHLVQTLISIMALRLPYADGGVKLLRDYPDCPVSI
jgi:hypothetical protein